MKKLLSLVLALAIVVSAMAMLSVVTTSAAAEKQLVNGNAEDTTGAGWGVMHGGSVAIVEETGNTTNHVAKFTPSTATSNNYSTITYDFTPAIRKDAANGYVGGGAGVYNISFRYKAIGEYGTKSTFKVYLTSANHDSASNIKALLGESAFAVDTYTQMTPGTLTMSSDWQTYEGSIAVSQPYLDMLEALKAAGKSNANTLQLRICGSSNAYNGNTPFEYYIDDITIEKEPVAVGKKVEVTTAYYKSHPYFRFLGNFTDDDVVTEGENSYIPVSYDIYNTSDTAYTYLIQVQANWTGFDINSKKEIAAGAKDTVSLKIPVKKVDGVWYATKADGTIAVDKHDTDPNGEYAKCTLSKIYVRIEFAAGRNGNYPVGTSFVVALNGENDPLMSKTSISNDADTANGGTGAATVTNVYTLPEIVEPSATATTGASASASASATATVAPTPVGKKFTVTEAYVNAYPYMRANAGFTAEDVVTEDGKSYIPVSYDVYNVCDIDINVNVYYQVYYTSFGCGAEKKIAAGQMATYDIKIPVKQVDGVWYATKADGTIASSTHLSQDATLDLLVFRTDLVKSGDYPVGLSYIIAANGEDDPVLTIDKASRQGDTGKLAIEDVFELPEISEADKPKEPTGVTLEVIEDFSGNAYLKAADGSVSADDIKKGVYTKKFLVKNEGEEDIHVLFTVQGLQNKQWKSPADSETEKVLIAAGEQEWVEVTFPVNDNNTVEIGGEEISFSTLFYRFDITNEAGASDIAAGTKLTIYCTGSDFDAMSTITAGAKKAWTNTTIYTAPSASTGDTLPVAMIATVVVAFVGLAVVAVKKKED